MTFAAQLTEWRTAHILTQSQAASMLWGTSVGTYKQWESGRRIPAESVQRSVLEKLRMTAPLKGDHRNRRKA